MGRYVCVFIFLVLPSLCVGLSNDTCVLSPSTPDCTGYQLSLPEIQANIAILCTPGTGMPHMGGCTIKRICDNTPSLASDPFCNAFSIYKDLCLDMPMNGCQDFVSMCSNTSVIEQCKTRALPLPGSGKVLPGLITSICQMSMPECSQCIPQALVQALVSNPSAMQALSGDRVLRSDLASQATQMAMSMLQCDMLQVYSDLCMSMPDMTECSSWKVMCYDIPSWELCPGSSQAEPQMRMYFHTGILDYILFKDWVPRSNWAYALSFIAVFVAALLHEFLRMMRKRVEDNWQRNNYGDPVSLADESEAPLMNSSRVPPSVPGFKPNIDIPRALLHGLDVAWGLLVMLVAMTYNVGLFIAIILGAVVGVLVLGRFLYSSGYKPKTSCH